MLAVSVTGTTYVKRMGRPSPLSALTNSLGVRYPVLVLPEYTASLPSLTLPAVMLAITKIATASAADASMTVHAHNMASEDAATLRGHGQALLLATCRMPECGG